MPAIKAPSTISSPSHIIIATIVKKKAIARRISLSRLSCSGIMIFLRWGNHQKTPIAILKIKIAPSKKRISIPMARTKFSVKPYVKTPLSRVNALMLTSSPKIPMIRASLIQASSLPSSLMSAIIMPKETIGNATR